MLDDDLPVFGLNFPLRPGERTPRQQVDDAVANNALAAAFFDCRRRRRGAPIREWRKDLFVRANVLMANFPEASDALIANILLETDVLKRANITAPTVKNWLSKLRGGGIGYGR